MGKIFKFIDSFSANIGTFLRICVLSFSNLIQPRPRLNKQEKVAHYRVIFYSLVLGSIVFIMGIILSFMTFEFYILNILPEIFYKFLFVYFLIWLIIWISLTNLVFQTRQIFRKKDYLFLPAPAFLLTLLFTIDNSVDFLFFLLTIALPITLILFLFVKGLIVHLIEYIIARKQDVRSAVMAIPVKVYEEIDTTPSNLDES